MENERLLDQVELSPSYTAGAHLQDHEDPRQYLRGGTFASRGGAAFYKSYRSSLGTRKHRRKSWFDFHGIQKVFLVTVGFTALIIVAIAAMQLRVRESCDLVIGDPSAQGGFRCICQVDLGMCAPPNFCVTNGSSLAPDTQCFPRRPLGPLNAVHMEKIYDLIVVNSELIFCCCLSMVQCFIAFRTQNMYQMINAWLVTTTTLFQSAYRGVSLFVTWGTPTDQGTTILLWIGLLSIGATACMFRPLSTTFGAVRFERGAFGNDQRRVLEMYNQVVAGALLDNILAILFYTSILFFGSVTKVVGIVNWVFTDVLLLPYVLYFLKREKTGFLWVAIVIKTIFVVFWITEISSLIECFAAYIRSSDHMSNMYRDVSTFLFPSADSVTSALLEICPTIAGLRVNENTLHLQFVLFSSCLFTRGRHLYSLWKFIRMTSNNNTHDVLKLFFDLPQSDAPLAKLVINLEGK